MTAGTSALLLLIGGGVVGVAAWAEDDPSVVTAGPDEYAVPDGGGAASEAPPPTADAEPPIRPVPHRAPGSIGHVTPKATTVTATAAPETPAGRPLKIKTTTPGTAVPRVVTGEPRPRPTTPRAAPRPERPVITTRTETETREIPFRTRLIRDPALPRGTEDVRAEGKAGVRSLQFVITLTDGKRTGRRLVATTVTKRPEPRLVTIGVGHHQHHDKDHDGDRDPGADPWGCDPDVCLPFGRSGENCEESDEHDSSGSGAGMIVLGGSVIDDADLGLPDGYDWDC